MGSNSVIRLSEEVAQAKLDQDPIVCLESTVFSQLGLPSPANAEALDRCINILRSHGVVPAVTAVINGELRLGLEDLEYDLIFSASKKVSVRDLPIAVGQGLPLGVTTVSASLAIAEAAGEKVFCTGGIGGVHRDSSITGDISADLFALAQFNVLCVCAGAKVFLDLSMTLEFLETLGVPVVGWQTNTLPAFYLRDSGLLIPRINSEKEVFTALEAINRLGLSHGMLLNVPIPPDDELNPEKIWSLIEECVKECGDKGISGQEVTPFILARLAEGTFGESIPANLALLENNAEVASRIARFISSQR